MNVLTLTNSRGNYLLQICPPMKIYCPKQHIIGIYAAYEAIHAFPRRHTHYLIKQKLENQELIDLNYLSHSRRTKNCSDD